MEKFEWALESGDVLCLSQFEVNNMMLRSDEILTQNKSGNGEVQEL